MATYQVGYLEAVYDDLAAIPGNIQKRIKRAIEERLATAPDRYGERLRRDMAGLWKLRVGGYRVVYEIRGSRVIVWAIQSRGKIYPEAERRWRGR